MDDPLVIRGRARKVLLRVIPKLNTRHRRKVIATIKKRIYRSLGFTPVWVSVDRLEILDRQIAVMLTKELGKVRIHLIAEMDKHTHQKLWVPSKAILVRRYAKD